MRSQQTHVCINCRPDLFDLPEDPKKIFKCRVADCKESYTTDENLSNHCRKVHWYTEKYPETILILQNIKKEAAVTPEEPSSDDVIEIYNGEDVDEESDVPLSIRLIKVESIGPAVKEEECHEILPETKFPANIQTKPIIKEEINPLNAWNLKICKVVLCDISKVKKEPPERVLNPFHLKTCKVVLIDHIRAQKKRKYSLTSIKIKVEQIKRKQLMENKKMIKPTSRRVKRLKNKRKN